MALVLVANESGCRLFADDRTEGERELAGRKVNGLARGPEKSCLAIVDEFDIWRRESDGAWSKLATMNFPLQSLIFLNGFVFAGGMNDAVMARISVDGKAVRLESFDMVAGREEWFAGGPPLGVRALAATADGSALLAGVHVGGIPRLTDMGGSWAPTLPVMFDVHEVCAHPALPKAVAAAAAVGLCVSEDGGQSWSVHAEGLETPYALAVAWLSEEALFSVQDGPFAKRSQIWRRPLRGGRLTQVREGLPEWLEGKVDTAQMTASAARAAIVDGGGTLWLSSEGSTGWERMVGGLGYISGLLILGVS